MHSGGTPTPPNSKWFSATCIISPVLFQPLCMEKLPLFGIACAPARPIVPTLTAISTGLGQPIARFLSAERLPVCADAATFVGVASLYAEVLSGAALVGHHPNQVEPFGRSLTFGRTVDLVPVRIGEDAVTVEDIRTAVNDGHTGTTPRHLMKEAPPRVVETGSPVRSGRYCMLVPKILQLPHRAPPAV